MKRIIILSTFLLIPFLSWSQIDSALLRIKDLCYKDFETAIELADSLIDLANCTESDIAEAMLYKGIAQYFLGNHDGAAEVYYQTLRKYEGLNNPQGQARVLNELGTLHKKLGNFEDAEIFFKKAGEFAIQANDSLGLASSFNNLGLIYSAKEEWNKAIALFNKSSEIKRNLKLWNDLSYDLNNLAYAYLAKKNYPKAIDLMSQSLAFRRQANNKRAIAISINNLGEIYLEANSPEKALYYFNQADSLSTAIGFTDLLAHVLNMRSKTKEKLGDFNGALTDFKEYKVIADSLFSLSKAKKTNELEAKYATEKKDKEIALLNNENALKESTIKQNYGLITLLILLIIVLLLSLYAYKQNTAKKIQQSKLQAKKNQIVAVFNSQESERKRIASEVHDGLGQLVTAFKLQLLKWGTPDSEEQKQLANKTLEELRSEIKNLSHLLLPNTLQNQGLEAALDKWVYRLNTSDKIRLNLNCFDLPKNISQQIQLHLYRIAQEWISNIINYNEAKNIFIQIVGHENEIIMTIEDDGFGFKPEIFTKGYGNGYQTLMSRLEIIKGHFNLDSAEGKQGSHFEITLQI